MATKTGTFTTITTTGNQAITSVGFQPKLVVIWGSINSGGEDAFVETEALRPGFGFADGTTQFAMCGYGADNVTTTSGRRQVNERVLMVITGARPL